MTPWDAIARWGVYLTIVLVVLGYLARRFRKGAVAESEVERLEDEQENEFDAQKELDRPLVGESGHLRHRVAARRKRMSKPHQR